MNIPLRPSPEASPKILASQRYKASRQGMHSALLLEHTHTSYLFYLSLKLQGSPQDLQPGEHTSWTCLQVPLFLLLSPVASSTLSSSFVSLPPVLINIISKSPGLVWWILSHMKSKAHTLPAGPRQTCSRPRPRPKPSRVTVWGLRGDLGSFSLLYFFLMHLSHLQSILLQNMETQSSCNIHVLYLFFREQKNILLHHGNAINTTEQTSISSTNELQGKK